VHLLRGLWLLERRCQQARHRAPHWWDVGHVQRSRNRCKPELQRPDELDHLLAYLVRKGATTRFRLS
ncbi:hypothetical protein B0H17DRAFT_1060286, partial [Mycena rosella]